MYLERYSYHVEDDFLNFQFTSEGLNGKVVKVVKFTPIERNLYNLGFGDLDESCGRINDMTVTNNGDSIKVLATVAATVHDFSLCYPKSHIIIQGSTHSRTRLYRRGITRHWKDIAAEFEVFGLMGEIWEPFSPSRDYDAFLVKPR